MRKIFAIILTLLSLSSCTNKDVSSLPKNEGNKLVYTNLVTKKSKDDLKNIMLSTDLDKSNINRFYKQVDFFNKQVNKNLLVNKDYEKSDKIKDYDFYAIQDELYKKYPSFIGVNCRITSFGLVSDKIKVANTKNPNLSVVEIDNSSFKDSPIPTLNKNEIERFNKFYSAIPTDNKNDADFQIKKIKDFWKKNGIEFPHSQDYSLISVFVFSNIDQDTNELFIGHTGLLFNTKDGRYMLVEKLAFTAPYQAVIFNNKNYLYDYLIELYDFSNKQYPIKPLIFEDDKILEK